MNPSAIQGEARLRGLPRAVGMNPSAIQGEARLCGLERIMYSKTISPHEQSHAQQQTMSDVFSHRPTCMSVAAWEAQCSLRETVCWTPKPAADAIVGMRGSPWMNNSIQSALRTAGGAWNRARQL